MLFSTNIRGDPAARCTVDGSVLPAPDTRAAWYQGAVRHRPDLSGGLEENRVVFSWLFCALPHLLSQCQEIPSCANRSQRNVLFVYFLTLSSF